MSNCSSGCPAPGTHETWGDCVKSKGTRIGWANSAAGVDLSKEKRWQAGLQEYRAARKQGVRPASPLLSDVRDAVRISNETGTAHKAA